MSNQVYKNPAVKYSPSPSAADVLTLGAAQIRVIQAPTTVVTGGAYFDKLNGTAVASATSGGVTYVTYGEQAVATLPYYAIQAQSNVDAGTTSLYIKQDCMLQIQYAIPWEGTGTNDIYAMVFAVAPDGSIRKSVVGKNTLTTNGAKKVATLLGEATVSAFAGDRVKLVLTDTTGGMTMHITSVGNADFNQDAYISPCFMRITVM